MLQQAPVLCRTPSWEGTRVPLRLSAVVTAVLLGIGLLTPPVASAEVILGQSAIAWSSCTDAELGYLQLECGRLEVPLDYAQPDGAKISLALTRRAHTSAEADFQGVMLTNPGGPGGSGLTLPSLGDYVPGGVGSTYDWIGFDPRGVGASTPSLHCTRSYFGVNRPNYVPRTSRLYAYWLRKNRGYADACANTATKRALLAHLTTMDTVRDMESIRVALGADTLNYYGFSYGTYLGQVYATANPTRVGRFVLDGVVNPGRVWYAANLDQDRAFDANLNSFWQYLAQHPGSFKLGNRWRAIRTGYYRELRKLDRRAAAGGRLGPSELADAMLDAGYYVYDWASIGRAYSALKRRNRGAAIFARYRDSQMGDDNGFAVYNGVQCSDTSWPDWARTRADSWAVHRTAPFLTWGNTWYNAPCLSWHAPRSTRPVVSGSAVTSKILLISETRDAATPYSGALAVRSLFPTASLVAGIGGTTHAGSLSGVACVDNTVASYLRTGIVPPRLPGSNADRACPRILPPGPSSAFGRTTTPGDRLSPLLRRDLTQAQRHTAG